MSAITKHDGAFSLYLVSLSAVITATVGVLFGIGFLLLAPPDSAAPPAESVSPPLTPGSASGPATDSVEPDSAEAARRHGAVTPCSIRRAYQSMCARISGAIFIGTPSCRPSYLTHAARARRPRDPRPRRVYVTGGTARHAAAPMRRR
jgi:hypothetical protein